MVFSRLPSSGASRRLLPRAGEVTTAVLRGSYIGSAFKNARHRCCASTAHAIVPRIRKRTLSLLRVRQRADACVERAEARIRRCQLASCVERAHGIVAAAFAHACL